MFSDFAIASHSLTERRLSALASSTANAVVFVQPAATGPYRELYSVRVIVESWPAGSRTVTVTSCRFMAMA